jgi:hypothetical protein
MCKAGLASLGGALKGDAKANLVMSDEQDLVGFSVCCGSEPTGVRLAGLENTAPE